MAASFSANTKLIANGRYKQVTIDWVSAANGSVSGTFSEFGELLRVITDPGSPAPDSAYDLVINDEFGIDILAGQGANLSATASANVCPGTPLKDGTTTSVIPMTIAGTLTVAITNAGDSKAGKIVLLMR